MTATRALTVLAQRVVDAEQALTKGPLSWTEGTAERVRRYLEQGQRMNSLGELQANGAGFDVAIARLEEASAAFTACWHYLAPLRQEGDEFDGWLARIVQGSPRLLAEVARYDRDHVGQTGDPDVDRLQRYTANQLAKGG